VTWEDVEPLRQHFSGAVAWGQAATYGCGDVMTLTPADVGNEAEEGMDSVPSARRPNTRAKKPNRNVIGTEWM
jgi:hypothetical protein